MVNKKYKDLEGEYVACKSNEIYLATFFMYEDTSDYQCVK